MVTRKYNLTGPTSIGPTSADADFSLVETSRDNIIVPGSTSNVVDQDANLTQHTSATVDREMDLIASESVVGTLAQGVVWSSLNEAIATVDQNGVVSRVSDGTVGILARTKLVTRRKDVSVAREGGQTVNVFGSWVDGSLAKHCAVAIDSLITGMTGTSAEKLIRAGSSYSTACWAYSLREKLTCVSLNQPRATAITPRHVLMSGHDDYYQPVGSTVYFLATDGTIISRTITAIVTVGPGGYETDNVVGLLDSDLPGSITPCKVAPSNLADLIPGIFWGVPCLCIDRKGQALVGDLWDIDGMCVFRAPSDATRLAFFETRASGDSSNPVFARINSDLALATTWTFAGAGSGPNVSANHGYINTAIAAADSAGGVSTGYTLTVADCSGFTDFSA